MKQLIIFATGNKGKIREIRDIITDPDTEVLSMKEAGVTGPEDAEHFLQHSQTVHDGAKKVLSRMGKRRAVTEDELREMIRIRARMFGVAEDCYDLSLYNHAQLLRILKSAGFGGPIENVLAERNQDSYTVQVSSDPLTLAQYAYEPVMSTHMVTVVGWDDTFAAENWQSGRSPRRIMCAGSMR